MSAKSIGKNLTNLDVKDKTPDTLQSPEQIQKKSVIQKRSSLPSSSKASCSQSSPADASASVDVVKKPRRTNKRKKEKFIVSSKLVAGPPHDKNSPHPSKKIKIEDDLTPTYDIINDYRGRVTRSGLHVPCHCDQCMPCSGPCCENPAVRAGRCCDPATLGSCLQPLEVRFIISKLRRNFYMYECECSSVRPFQTFD